MARTEREQRARASLLDRLVDTDPYQTTEPVPLREVPRSALAESVRRELARLLNTRVVPHAGERPRTVIDYGVRDFTPFYPANQENRRALAMMVAQSLAAFEPRLANVRVTVHPGGMPHELLIGIEATLVGDGGMVSFPVTVRNRGAAIEVNHDE